MRRGIESHVYLVSNHAIMSVGLMFFGGCSLLSRGWSTCLNFGEGHRQQEGTRGAGRGWGNPVPGMRPRADHFHCMRSAAPWERERQGDVTAAMAHRTSMSPAPAVHVEILPADAPVAAAPRCVRQGGGVAARAPWGFPVLVSFDFAHRRRKEGGPTVRLASVVRGARWCRQEVDGGGGCSDACARNSIS